MTVNGIGLVAIIVYTCWRYHSIMNRYYRHDSNVRIVLDVTYSGLMIWLLSLGHVIFILSHLAVAIGAGIVGMYYWIRAGPLPGYFESEGRGLKSYWHHLALDTMIGLVAWFTMLGGGTIT
jgi:hypothetical protein